ncbi:hypothetical protein ACFQ0M_20790 [Kitasatospora aburaviensis]
MATGEYVIFLDSDDTLTPACSRPSTPGSRPAATRTSWSTTTPGRTPTAGPPGPPRRTSSAPTRRTSSTSTAAPTCWTCCRWSGTRPTAAASSPSRA